MSFSRNLFFYRLLQEILKNEGDLDFFLYVFGMKNNEISTGFHWQPRRIANKVRLVKITCSKII